MSITNIPKPTTSLTNSTRIGFGETWASITTTWATETRNWLDTASLLTNTTKPATGTRIDSFSVPPTTAARNDYTGSLGYRFTVSSTITVSQLGRLYVAGNTLNHTINLWISTNTVTPIASVTLTSSISSDINNFKYADVTPVILTTGNTYSITSNESNGLDTWKDLWVSGTDIQSIFTNINSIFSNTHDTYPTLGGTPLNIYNTCSMKYFSGLSTSITNVAKPI